MNIGDYETYSVQFIPDANYIWTAPAGWTGTSVSNSITFHVGTSSGNISLYATNYCGSSQVQSIYVTSKVGIDNNNLDGFSIKNYPNPFKDFTKIEFEMPYSGKIIINLFQLSGNYISTITDGYFMQGKHEITFDGRKIPAGNYFFLIEFDFGKKIYTSTNIMNIIK